SLISSMPGWRLLTEVSSTTISTERSLSTLARAFSILRQITETSNATTGTKKTVNKKASLMSDGRGSLWERRHSFATIGTMKLTTAAMPFRLTAFRRRMFASLGGIRYLLSPVIVLQPIAETLTWSNMKQGQNSKKYTPRTTNTSVGCIPKPRCDGHEGKS